MTIGNGSGDASTFNRDAHAGGLVGINSGTVSQSSASGNVTGGGNPVRVRVNEVDAALLPVLGVKPVLGRDFLAEENKPGHDGEAILSWAFWQSRFGGENVIGRKMLVDDEPHTIVGVLPREFNVMGDSEVWLPATFDLNYFGNRRGFHSYSVFGRLKPGVALDRANAELAAKAASLAKAFPRQNQGVGAVAVSLRDYTTGEARPVIMLLFGAVVCVLPCIGSHTQRAALPSARAYSMARGSASPIRSTPKR